MAERVGVEPQHSTPNSRQMMTLQLPPRSNWSQLESIRDRSFSVRGGREHKTENLETVVRVEFERLHLKF